MTARFSDVRPGSIECRQGRSGVDFDQLQKLRATAWVKEGKPSFDLSTIHDDFTRQVIINEANRQFGPRREGN